MVLFYLVFAVPSLIVFLMTAKFVFIKRLIIAVLVFIIPVIILTLLIVNTEDMPVSDAVTWSPDKISPVK